MAGRHQMSTRWHPVERAPGAVIQVRGILMVRVTGELSVVARRVHATE
jgi:hypothetical protein